MRTSQVLLSPPMNKYIARLSARAMINNTVMAFIAFFAGYNFTALFHEGTSQEGGLWSVVSAVMVLESKWSETSHSAVFRIIGSFLGAAISGTYLYFYHFSAIGLAICIGVGVFVCHLLGITKYVKLTSLTIAVVMIISVINNDIEPFMNAALRFAESVIGTIVAVMVAYVSHLIYSDAK